MGKIDAFECPKTKKLFHVVDIVTISNVKKKKYTCDYCIPCEFKSECTSQYQRIFYEHFDPYIEEYADITIQTKDKTYISKEGILLKQDLQFY